MTWFFVAVVSVYALAEYTASRGAAYWVPTYAVVWSGVLICLIGASRKTVGSEARRNVKYVLWVVVFGLIAVAANDSSSARYVLGDLSFMLLLAACTIYFGKLAPQANLKTQLAVTLVVLFVLALLAPVFARLNLFPELARSNYRYDAPATFLITVCLVLLFSHARTLWRKIFILLVLTVLVGLTFYSGWRIYLIRDFVIILAGVVLVARRKILLLPAGVLAAMLPIAFSGAIVEVLLSTRFSDFVYFELDRSSVGRLLEVKDIFREFAFAESPLRYIFGFGHGATFSVFHTVAEVNAVGSGGEVHHVHIGPAMMYFRYGLFGLALYLYLWVLVARCLASHFAMTRNFPIDFWGAAVTLSAFGVLVLSLAVNVFNSVLQILILSLLLAGHGRYRVRG